MTGRELFDAVVAASGLASLVAPFTISRLLARADLTADDLRPEHLDGLMDDLEQGLAVYLPDAEVAAALARIRALAA